MIPEKKLNLCVMKYWQNVWFREIIYMELYGDFMCHAQNLPENGKLGFYDPKAMSWNVHNLSQNVQM
jgi:hypothetical protein